MIKNTQIFRIVVFLETLETSLLTSEADRQDRIDVDYQVDEYKSP